MNDIQAIRQCPMNYGNYEEIFMLLTFFEYNENKNENVFDIDISSLTPILVNTRQINLILNNSEFYNLDKEIICKL